MTNGGLSLPLSKRQLAQIFLENDSTVKHIVKEVRCNLTTAYKYKDNVCDCGETLAPSISRIGRTPILTAEILEVLSFSWLQKQEKMLMFRILKYILLNTPPYISIKFLGLSGINMK